MDRSKVTHTINGITNAIGAASLADKLIARISTEQTEIETVLSDVSALWPLNILEQMETLLEARDYAGVSELLETWTAWLASMDVVQTKMRRTAAIIEGFVEFYAE